MKRIKYFSFLLIFTLTAISCSEKSVNFPEKQTPPGNQEDIPWPSLANSPWPMNHHDPQSTGRSSGNGPLAGKINWQINIPGVSTGIAFTDIAIGADSTIYFGSSYEPTIQGQMSYLYAVSIDGNIKWKFPLNYPFVDSSPIVASNGTIYIGSGDSNLYAIDLTGMLKWKYAVDASIFQAGMNIDKTGNIYFTSIDGKLTSLDSHGNFRWQIMPDGGLFANAETGISFSPDGKTLYAPGAFWKGSKTLYAISIEGNVQWTFGTGVSIAQPLVDSQGNIYFWYDNPNDSSNSGFLSLDSSGKKRWVYRVGEGLLRLLSTIDKNGNIYFSGDKGIISLDYNGNLRQGFNANGLYATTALTCDNSGNIYYALSDFIALNNDGSLKYSVPINDFNYSTPAIGYGKIFLGSVGNPKILFSIE